MKYLAPLFAIFLFSYSEAQILIQAPAASESEYNLFLAENPSVKSYSKFLLEKLSMSVEQEQQLFALADLPPSEIENGLETIQRLNRQAALSELSTQFLLDLTGKWKSQSLPDLTKRRLQELVCKLQLQSGQPATDCPVKNVSLVNLKKMYPWMHTLAIESQASLYGKELPIIETAEYHFTVISNSHEAVSFYGTFAELLQHSANPKSLIDGDCHGFQTNIEDLGISLQSRIFFSASCLKAVHNPEENQKNWMQRNKKWLIPAAAVLLGGGLYAMKDKKLVFEKP